MCSRRDDQQVTVVLLDALTGRVPTSRTEVDDVRLTRAAVWHGVTGYVFEHLLASGYPRAHLPSLEVACLRAAAAHLLMVADLRDVQATLHARSVRFLALKGPVVAESLHGSGVRRGYGDLDLLVAPADLKRAVVALEGAGACMLDRNWNRLARERRGQCHLTTRRETLVDLHWHLVNDVELRAALALPTEDLFARAADVAVGPLIVATTDAVDTLLHLCMHATMSGGDRLIWYKDVELAAAATADWDEVVRRATAAGSGLLVGSALAGAARVLGCQVPAEVQRALAPSRLWRLVNVVGARVSPPERLRGEGALHRMIGRSTRTDVRSSALELARRAGKHLRPGAGDGKGGDLFDPATPDSLLSPSGDREEFFALVAAHSTANGRTAR